MKSMHKNNKQNIWPLHIGFLALLAVLHFILPAYHHDNLSRIMILACFACAYNISFGYCGLLSLGHAMFFAAGMYGCSLAMMLGGITLVPALLIGVLVGLSTATIVGVLSLRTNRIAFMIITLMFAQAAYLTILHFGAYTRGDEGFVIPQALRHIGSFDLSQANHRYIFAWSLFAIVLLGQLWLVRSAIGRVFLGIRENPQRVLLCGYNPYSYKLLALVLSGSVSAAAGASYAVLFGYSSATFADVQYSILPLLWVLLGGSGTVLGPFIGVLLMFYLIDLSSGYSSAYLIIVGIVLLVLILWARQGIVGTIRQRWLTWLP